MIEMLIHPPAKYSKCRNGAIRCNLRCMCHSGLDGRHGSRSQAIAKGHGNSKTLRDLLIWTTSTTTAKMVSDYFRRHFNDHKLLRDLMDIALEGDDAGDAPWAAANVIAEFPASMLRELRKTLKN